MNTHLPCNLELPRMVVRPSGQMTSSIILMQSMHMATSARLYTCVSTISLLEARLLVLTCLPSAACLSSYKDCGLRTKIADCGAELKFSSAEKIRIQHLELRSDQPVVPSFQP